MRKSREPHVQIRATLCADDVLADLLMRAGLALPALAEKLRAVGIFILDEMVIENLAVQLRVVAHLPCRPCPARAPDAPPLIQFMMSMLWMC